MCFFLILKITHFDVTRDILRKESSSKAFESPHTNSIDFINILYENNVPIKGRSYNLLTPFFRFYLKH